MKYLKITLAFLFCTFVMQSMDAQSAQNNLLKYWKHRHRLTGDGSYDNVGFMKVGSGPGTMIPAERLVPFGSCYGDATYGSNAGSCNGTWGLYQEDDRGAILFGADGTHYLGHLIATLASEYALLLNSGEDSSKSLEELYLALEAYERLDVQAEVEFGYPGELNGFFLRDDVPTSMLTDFQDPQNQTNYQCIQSNLICNEGRIAIGQEYTNLMSQDQAIYILMGLSVVKAVVPPGTMHNGEDVLIKAQTIAHLIGSFLRDSNWMIRNPNGDKVHLGANALWLSYPIAEAVNIITENNTSLGFERNYQNFSSQTAGRVSWQTAKRRFVIGLYGGDVNDALILTCAAMSGLITTPEMNLAVHLAEIEMWGLLYSFLHNKSLYSGNKLFLETAMDTAPCDKFCNINPGSGWGTWLDCNNNNGWRASNRWFHDSHRNGGGSEGIHNGLDYMLLYNLYQLVYPTIHYSDSWEGTTSHELDYPRMRLGGRVPPGWIACSTCFDDPGFLQTQGTIATDSYLYNFDNIPNPLNFVIHPSSNLTPADMHAHLTMRSGTAIVLKPGFTVESGAYFNAYIDSLECDEATNIINKTIVETPRTTTEPAFIKQASLESFDVFPNPSRGQFNIKIRLAEEEAVQIRIYDLSGKQVYAQQEAAIQATSMQVDLSHLPKGLYLVKLEKESGILHRKVVLQE